MERYRDINRLLVDFAARLPWLVGGTGAGAHDDEVTSRGKPDKRRKKKEEGAAPSRARRKDVKTDITWHGDRASNFVNNMMSQGACLIDPTGVVSLRCLES